MGVTFFILLLCAISAPEVWAKKHSHKKHHQRHHNINHHENHRHHSKPHGKIVGGYTAAEGEFPYQVFLDVFDGDGESYRCGGSIIGDRTILSAAHCFEDIVRVVVRIGSNLANSGGKIYRTRNFTVHPDYDDVEIDNDYAIVKTREDMDFTGTFAKPIALTDTADIPDGTEILVSGWGLTSDGGEVSEELMAVKVRTISNEECDELNGGITDRMFCAGTPEGGKDACEGDSGGPAVANGVLVGIVSYGDECGNPEEPGVYARVGAALDWIRENS